MFSLLRSSRALLFVAVAAGCSAGSSVGPGGDGGGGFDAGTTGTNDGGADSGIDPASELCNGVDDDGDGRVDEMCQCEVGASQPCYPGDPTLAGVGQCALGAQTCLENGVEFGAWSACTGATPPSDELCDGIDNDCDGTVDDGCECELGATRPCYEGPDGTVDVGICEAGVERCVAGAGGIGTSWAACTGAIEPGVESCNGQDDDCNGSADEGCGCTGGLTRDCYTGTPGTEDVGPCRSGVQRCTSGSDGSATWGMCEGAIVPMTDICNGADDDCDGTADQDCLCAPGAVSACWSGDPTLRSVGACRDGSTTCELGAMGAGSAWGACAGERGPSGELCNGIDDDCDGLLDEGCTCREGATRTCYSGTPGTGGVGVCRTGTQVCVLAPDGASTSWGACAGEITPGPETCFDGVDGDCDGGIDDGCVCTSGSTRACYTGASDTRGVGICRDGSQPCVIGAGDVGSDWGTCTGSTTPATETCNGVDDDCDGATDEGCSCSLGAMRSCYGGPPSTQGVGRCRGGTQTCEAMGGTTGWGACAGAVLPGAEVCNGADDNCDAVVDDGCACDPGTTRACYSGSASTRMVGACRDGWSTCTAGAGGVGSSWGACNGSTTPATELCDGIDNDCNATVDDGCECTPRTTRSCYTGPAMSEGVGICRAGTQTCVLSPDGTSSSWASCSGATLPAGERCDGIDNDCDGVVDDGCACIPGSTRACYGGLPASTRGVGLCRDGSQLCVSGMDGIGSSWAACSGSVVPASEVCDGADNDCDGLLDENCTCTAGQSRACYSGPPSTRLVGTCRDGSQMCVISGGVASWGACAGERLPMSETCDGTDQDCDGAIDDGACSMPPTITCPPNRTTTALVPVTITGNASDPDGGVIATWRWALENAPPGATGTFGNPNVQTTTFTPNLIGVYTIRLTVTDDEGQSASCLFTVTAQGLGLRIEVSWDTSATDIDTHLLRRAGGTPWFNDPNDCYYVTDTPSWDAPGTADDPRLDIDDVNGFGPENINIDVPVTGSTYRVGIHFYDDWGNNTPTHVTVRIYCGDISISPVRTFTRTLTVGENSPDSNEFWRVADVRWDGGDACTVTNLDTITTGGGARTTP
jgi:hypothetical protein